MTHVSECIHSGLDLFESPGLQTSILHGEYVEYRPLAALEANTPIEFAVTGSTQYLDLASSFLRVRARVVQPDGAALAADTDVVPMNLTLHTMFSDVIVYLNNVQLSTPSGCYPYQSYLQTLLSYSPDTKDSQLEAAMWYSDSGGHMSDTAGNDNTGMKKRKARSAESAPLDMMGRLHCDLFHQSKYLLNHLDMRVKLTRSKDAFVLSGAAVGGGGGIPKYKLELIDCSLNIRRVEVSPTVALAHAKTLEKANAVYPLTKTVMRVFTAAQGSFSLTVDNLFLDKVPNKIVMGFVRAEAFNGSYALNPFDFEHADVNFVSLYHEGRQIPSKGLRPDYENNQYTRAFMSLFTGGGNAWNDITCGVTLADYKQGYTLYFFDLTPSLTQSHAAAEIQRPGPLRVEFQFSKALAHSMNLVIYSETDARLEISHTREVLLL